MGSTWESATSGVRNYLTQHNNITKLSRKGSNSLHTFSYIRKNDQNWKAGTTPGLIFLLQDVPYNLQRQADRISVLNLFWKILQQHKVTNTCLEHWFNIKPRRATYELSIPLLEAAGFSIEVHLLGTNPAQPLFKQTERSYFSYTSLRRICWSSQ